MGLWSCIGRKSHEAATTPVARHVGASVRPGLQLVWAVRAAVVRAIQTPTWRMKVRGKLRYYLGLDPGVRLHTSVDGYVRIAIAGLGPRRVNWHRMYRADPCVYCGADAPTLDHIVPKSAGGKPYGWENQAPACGPCNWTKGNRPLWMVLMGRPGVSVRRKKKSQSLSPRAIRATRPTRSLTYSLGAKLHQALHQGS